MFRRQWIMLGVAVCLMGCSSSKQEEASNVKQYTLKGEVTALDPGTKVATINGEKIEGWMEAMTMDYPVKDEQEFSKLKVGDHITATIYVADMDYHIADIKKEPASPPSGN